MSGSTITCPVCGTSNPAGFNFCGNCGARLSASTSGGSAERRQITVMFCDLIGSVAMSLKLDPEDLRDVIHRYQEACVAAVEAFGGYVAQYLGDGIMAYFGYPVVHDAEAERAVRAGLDIIGRVEALSIEIRRAHQIDVSVRVGIDTGLVVVGEVGSGTRKEHLALGETPNRAARLQTLAPPNGLVVSEATQRLVADIFETEDLGPQALKGILDTERVYRILGDRLPEGATDLTGMPRRVSTVGREPELEIIRECWASVEEGAARIVILRGEPGIGKSHLVHLFRQELADDAHTRIECRCSPFLQGSPFHPIVDWMQRIFNFYPDQSVDERLDMVEFVCRQNKITDPDAPRLLAGLLSLPADLRYPNPGYSASRIRERTHEILETLLLQMADDCPLVFVLEDEQWIDPSTRGFLEQFAAGAGGRRILVLVTSRERVRVRWPSDLPVTILSLDKLDVDHVRMLVRDLAAPRELPESVVGQIVQKSDGIPLFVQEFTRMVLEMHAPDEEEETPVPLASADLSIPVTLHDSLMARLDRLHPIKEVAQMCSVIGREFTFELALAASRMGESTLAEALVELVRADVLVGEGRPPRSRYMFRHALIQEAAYESMLRTRRAVYHRRIARYLAEKREEEELDVIAHHLSRAGDREGAARYWLRAGRRAHERWANEEAVDYFTRGMALVRELPDSPENRKTSFFLQAGHAVALLPIRGYTHPVVLLAFERAAELADGVDDPAAAMPVVRGLWAYYTVLADHDRGAALAEYLEALARKSGQHILQDEAMAARASSLIWRGDARESRNLFETAMQGLRAIASEPPATLAFQHPCVGALSYLAFANWYLGETEVAMERSRESVKLADDLDHPFSRAFAYVFDAALKTYLGLRDEARKSAEQSFVISSRFGFPFWLNVSRVLSGWAMAPTDVDEAIEQMRGGLNALQSAGVRIWTAYPSALLAQLLGDAGRPDEALELLDAVVDRNRSNGEGFLLPEILRLRARQLDALDRHTEAAADRKEAVQLAQQQGARPILLRVLMDVIQTEDRPDPALRDLLRTTADGYDDRLNLADVTAARRLLAT